MSDKTGIMAVIIFYIIIASTFIALIDNTENDILGEFSGSFYTSVNLSESGFGNIKYSVISNDADYEITSSGLHLINATSDSAYVQFNFPTFKGETEGYYIYHIAKGTNDRIRFSFYDSSSFAYDPVVTINNNNIYYGQGSGDIILDNLVYSNVGNDFYLKVEYSEDSNTWIYSINNYIFYTYTPSLFPILEVLSNVRNQVTLYEETTYIQSLEFSDEEVNTGLVSSFADIFAFTETIALLLIWNISSIPWWINLIAIKTPELILFYIVIMSIKGE